MDRLIRLQRLQTFNLVVLIVAAYAYDTLPVTVAELAIMLFVAESADLALQHGRRRFSFSALTTAMGVALMMYATQWWIYPLAILAAIAQKHRVKYRHAHLFNPSNFAVVSVPILFPQWSALHLGVLGENPLLWSAVVGVGALTLYFVDRLLLPIVYLSTYVALSYFLIVRPDPVMVWEDFLLRFYSVSTIVFVLFMLTDPRTTPQRWQAQSIFAAFVAIVSVALDRIFAYSAVHPFVALFVVTPAYVLYRERCRNAKVWAIWFFSVFAVIIATHTVGVRTVSEAIYY